MHESFSRMDFQWMDKNYERVFSFVFQKIHESAMALKWREGEHMMTELSFLDKLTL